MKAVEAKVTGAVAAAVTKKLGKQPAGGLKQTKTLKPGQFCFMCPHKDRDGNATDCWADPKWGGPVPLAIWNDSEKMVRLRKRRDEAGKRLGITPVELKPADEADPAAVLEDHDDFMAGLLDVNAIEDAVAPVIDADDNEDETHDDGLSFGKVDGFDAADRGLYTELQCKEIDEQPAGEVANKSETFDKGASGGHTWWAIITNHPTMPDHGMAIKATHKDAQLMLLEARKEASRKGQSVQLKLQGPYEREDDAVAICTPLVDAHGNADSDNESDVPDMLDARDSEDEKPISIEALRRELYGDASKEVQINDATPTTQVAAALSWKSAARRVGSGDHAAYQPYIPSPAESRQDKINPSVTAQMSFNTPTDLVHTYSPVTAPSAATQHARR